MNKKHFNASKNLLRVNNIRSEAGIPVIDITNYV